MDGWSTARSLEAELFIRVLRENASPIYLCDLSQFWNCDRQQVIDKLAELAAVD